MTPAYSIKLNEEQLASALMLTIADIRSCFSDGRVASRFVEHWAERMFGVIKYLNTNHQSSDGYYELADGSKIEVSIRTLTDNGIRFQDSKFMGVGRSCSVSDLKASIRRADQWIVFDITPFPLIRAMKIKCSVLEHWIDMGELTPSGLSYSSFCKLLNRDDVAMHRVLEQPSLI